MEFAALRADDLDPDELTVAIWAQLDRDRRSGQASTRARAATKTMPNPMVAVLLACLRIRVVTQVANQALLVLRRIRRWRYRSPAPRCCR